MTFGSNHKSTGSLQDCSTNQLPDDWRERHGKKSERKTFLLSKDYDSASLFGGPGRLDLSCVTDTCLKLTGLQTDQHQIASKEIRLLHGGKNLDTDEWILVIPRCLLLFLLLFSGLPPLSPLN
ncbi:hypothetical protein ILYODFUR_010788 [Ilyodon furcidens]|uniref:Uncharacterized protein n=1 Tax=Ilyodon furcidens TaxID=33524 RepID=A0ABV0UGW9_9TELE